MVFCIFSSSACKVTCSWHRVVCYNFVFTILNIIILEYIAVSLFFFFVWFFSEAKLSFSDIIILSLCLKTIHVITIKLTCMQWALGIVPQKKQKYQNKWILIYHKTSSEQYPLPFERLKLRFFFHFPLIACKLLFTMSNWNIDCHSRLDSNNDNYCIPSVSSNLVIQA